MVHRSETSVNVHRVCIHLKRAHCLRHSKCIVFCVSAITQSGVCPPLHELPQMSGSWSSSSPASTSIVSNTRSWPKPTLFQSVWAPLYPASPQNYSQHLLEQTSIVSSTSSGHTNFTLILHTHCRPTTIFQCASDTHS